MLLDSKPWHPNKDKCIKKFMKISSDSHICRDPCFWKKLRPKWTKNHSSINFWPIIKNDVRFFSLLNVDYGTAKKIAKFYSFGRFLGPKRLKIDGKWLNFACHFLNDPERWACGDFFIRFGYFILTNLNVWCNWLQEI